MREHDGAIAPVAPRDGSTSTQSRSASGRRYLSRPTLSQPSAPSARRASTCLIPPFPMELRNRPTVEIIHVPEEHLKRLAEEEGPRSAAAMILRSLAKKRAKDVRCSRGSSANTTSSTPLPMRDGSQDPGVRLGRPGVIQLPIAPGPG
jgi:hypothetical protein